MLKHKVKKINPRSSRNPNTNVAFMSNFYKSNSLEIDKYFGNFQYSFWFSHSSVSRS